MQRRDALRRMCGIGAGFFLSPIGLHKASLALQVRRTDLSSHDVLLLDEIGETILPASAASSGAKAAQIGLFMLGTINDCLSLETKKTLIEGLNDLEERCTNEFGRAFVDISAVEKTDFLRRLDPQEINTATHYFTVLKQLTIKGYVTSELGATQFLKYEAVPGNFKIIPYKKGDKRWATN